MPTTATPLNRRLDAINKKIDDFQSLFNSTRDNLNGSLNRLNSFFVDPGIGVTAGNTPSTPVTPPRSGGGVGSNFLGIDFSDPKVIGIGLVIVVAVIFLFKRRAG
jgi:hypothetical protein